MTKNISLERDGRASQAMCSLGACMIWSMSEAVMIRPSEGTKCKV